MDNVCVSESHVCEHMYAKCDSMEQSLKTFTQSEIRGNEIKRVRRRCSSSADKVLVFPDSGRSTGTDRR